MKWNTVETARSAQLMDVTEAQLGPSSANINHTSSRLANSRSK